ncbi:uncharacterized protein LOC111663153 [Seriola lalandi dorsalis]|uniref:uncharacterized protein LOC111663153 n=1 Tax=Seriola lalandi dorsalis TaxID=1841481 RepID=UPI000C6F612F|nr:uncharacterized protein LOC111663153 [Seriola lalandi dorsalis]
MTRGIMFATECQWSEALTSNNIRAIIRWLRTLTDEGDVDVEEILLTFSCWVQRTSEFAKKELLTLCFSRCQGLWMFLDRSSFARVHMLLQRLRNLLTLAQWARRQLTSAHLWHGVGYPCVVCRDTGASSDVRRACWNREHRALKQHIWLGRLVQWWGIMGLLPKYPEAHEVKRISQMWREMEHSHQKAYLLTLGWEEGGTERWISFIQGMVTQLDKQHGCIWTSEDFTDQCYPPPNLQALLKLVLVPRIDNMSVQAVLMYFILDMANFLQCKNDLLQSFCHAFTIPSSFSQQIRAFWMLDHGNVRTSMELLLSPRAAVPWLPWQHRCIIHCLLTRKQPCLALRYLQWTRPAIESTDDAKLCADVLLQNSCVSEAWALLKRGHTERDDMVTYFLQACHGFGLCAKALKYIPAGYNGEGDNVDGIETTESHLPLMKKDCSGGRPPCPLSAKLYQAQRVNAVSPEELVRLVRKAVMEVRDPPPKLSEVVWLEHAERKSNSRKMSLSTQALLHLTPSPSPMHMVEEQTEQTAHADEPDEEQPLYNRHRETHRHISSSEDQSSESVSSFTSASSLFLLRRGHPYVYESTLTLQRISSLLTDGENQSRDGEEEESRPPSSVGVLPDCPEMIVTPEGAADPMSLSNFNKDVLVELLLSAEEGEEDVNSGLSVDAVSGPSMDETLPLNKRMNHPPQLCSIELSQSVPSLCEPQLDLLSPGFDKQGKRKEIVHSLSHVAELWSSVLSQEDQSDSIPLQSFSFSEAAMSEELHQTACEHHQQEEALGCFNQDLSCPLLNDLHCSLLLEEPIASGSGILAKMAERGSSPLTPVCSLMWPTQLQIPGSSLTLSSTCNTQTSSAPSDTTNESPSKAQLKADEPCFQSTSTKPDHCKVGSWWREDIETYRAFGSLFPSTEPGAAFTSDTKRPSLVLSQPYPYSLLSFMDFTAKQKGDNRDGKQADKEEPTGWSSVGKASQGAIRSGRTRLRKGKRVKRA